MKSLLCVLQVYTEFGFHLVSITNVIQNYSASDLNMYQTMTMQGLL